MLQPLDGVDEGRQIGGHHALAQVAELDHGHHAVPAALPSAGPVECRAPSPISLCSDTSQRRTTSAASSGVGARSSQMGAVTPGVAQTLGVLEPGFAERDGAAVQQRPAHLGLAARDLGDADDLHRAERVR